jgi:hypothetical protein
MKQCPICKTTYTDDTLSFCLADGAGLFAVSDEEETRVIPKLPETVRIAIPQETAPVFTPPVFSQQSPAGGGKSKAVGVLLGVLALVILLFIGFAAFMILKSDDKKTDPKTSPSPTISQTPDSKIADLQKQIEDLKNQKSPTPAPTQSPPATTARVNSPNDGFLALRSAPNSETGYQILRIPHGLSVAVLGCQSFSVRISGRNGRWCEVNYGGQTGWAFDAWLDY